ncbi:hypothetical protein IQ272_31160 [Chroococcidiopsidales cyanobacterium LEGE 13417]|nr:hypothetical protein [Chroococcidiopsidales cyanobacterium LEGE 13417]
MSVNFDHMTDEELKRYMLAHRQDQEDRRALRPKKVLISAEEAKLPFDEYVKLANERMREHFGDRLFPQQQNPPQ